MGSTESLPSAEDHEHDPLQPEGDDVMIDVDAAATPPTTTPHDEHDNIISADDDDDDKNHIEMTPTAKSSSSLSMDRPAPAEQPRENDTHQTMPTPTVRDSLQNWAMTLVIGFLVPSYWRGTWTLMDLWLCDMPTSASLISGEIFCFSAVPEEFDTHESSAWDSCWIGWSLTFLGVALMWTSIWRPPATKLVNRDDDNNNNNNQHDDEGVKITPLRAALRWVTVYILGFAAVNLWRGVWYLADYHLLPDKLTDNGEGEFPLTSFWVSSVVGSSLCFLLGCGASLLAPPAIYLLDGPGVNPPPLAVTALSTYYSLTLPAGMPPPESLPWYVIGLDLLVSFWVVPIGVVNFWRGSWLLMDYYLWGFSLEEQDVHNSLAWSFIIGAVLLSLTSETLFAHILPMDYDFMFYTVSNETSQPSTPKHKTSLYRSLMNRFRTYLMAWGTVNWWRMVWYIWDEFLGGASYWSCWLSHWGALVILTGLGCMSCIVAPASTLGIDLEPHPNAADEPLFDIVPVPLNKVVPFSIGLQPRPVQQSAVPEQAKKQAESFVSQSVGRLEVQDDGGLIDSTVEKSQTHWSSGGTGAHPGYSSSRLPNESANNSYCNMQRPDLDRRVGASELHNALASSQVSVRSTSSYHRNR